MKLTIGIPVYNAEVYIERCLNTVLQARNADEHEVICIDDGSTDKSLDILKRYASTHRNVRVINTENKGAFLARSRVIDEARGEWIGFVDADDIISPQMYKLLLAETTKNSHIDMVVCAFYKMDLKSGKVKAVQMDSYGNQVLDFTKNPADRGLLAGVNPAYWNKIYKREKLQNRLQLDYSPRIMEDYLFAASVFPLIDGVAFIDAPLYNYYDVPFSVTKKIGWDELRDAEEGLQELSTYIKKSNWFTDVYKHDLITAMTCVHLGIAFTINWNDNEQRAPLRLIWINTKFFLDKEFAGWRENTYIRFRYIIKRKPLAKLYFSNLLFRCGMWPVIVRMYHIVCNIVGADLKW